MFKNMAKMFPPVVFFVLTILITFAQCRMLHERMTREEIFNTFHTTSEDVPNYHVVQIMHNMNKRDADGNHGSSIKIRTTSGEVIVYLEPTEGHLYTSETPVWTTYTNRDVLFYREQVDIVAQSITRYISRTQPAASIVSYNKRSTDERNFYGQIGDMAVWPLPKRLRKAAQKFDKNPDLPNVDDSWSQSHYHVLYARSKSTSSNLTEALYRDYKMAIDSSLFDNTHSSQGKRSIQSVVYPSILVTTDFYDYKLRPYNTNQVSDMERNDRLLDRIIYVLAFFNGIDLRFRALSNPKVRFHLAGIVIGTDRAAVPYINENRDIYGIVNGLKVVSRSLYSYWGGVVDVDYRSYHGILALTDSKLKDNMGGHGARKIICIKSNHENAAIVNDNKKFAGVEVATHELGHMLGADHDSVGENIDCNRNEGYIMAPNESPFTAINYKWSPCSLRQFTSFIRRQSVTCLDKEILSSGTKKIGLLPGKYVSANDQCIALMYEKACKATSERCKQLECYRMSSFGVVLPKKLTAPAEGTSCGYNKICLNGDCVDDPQPNKYIWDPIKKQSVDPWSLEASNEICGSDGSPNSSPKIHSESYFGTNNQGAQPTSSPQIHSGSYFGTNNQGAQPTSSRPINSGSNNQGGSGMSHYNSGSHFQSRHYGRRSTSAIKNQSGSTN